MASTISAGTADAPTPGRHTASWGHGCAVCAAHRILYANESADELGALGGYWKKKPSSHFSHDERANVNSQVINCACVGSQLCMSLVISAGDRDPVSR